MKISEGKMECEHFFYSSHLQLQISEAALITDMTEDVHLCYMSQKQRSAVRYYV